MDATRIRTVVWDTQSLIRKSVEKSVHGTVDVFFESVTNSMLEVSILYEESSMTDESSSALEEVTVDLFVEEDGPQDSDP
jgi:hypothetical protein